MSRPFKVLINGCGIAGSVFASCLLRAHPRAAITILERTPALRLTGASVDIRGAAIDVIKWMGVEPEIKQKCTREEGVQFVGRRGQPIATFRSTGRSDVQSVTSEYEIFRGTLVSIFLGLCKDRVNLRFGESVESFRNNDDRVQVRYRGKEEEEYDLVVGADGLGSKMRGLVFGTDPREQIHDEGVHAAWFTAKEDLLGGSLLAKWHNLTKGRCILLRPDSDPAGRTRVMLMNVTTNRQKERKALLNQAADEGSNSYLRLMDDEFQAGSWLTPQVLKNMHDADDFHCSIFAQIRCPSLTSGRVVLIGDSGYATPGMGTSLAIIGGYVLAGELARNPGDIKTALRQYEQFMLKMVKPQQSDNPAMQLLNPQTSLALQIRNAVIWLVTSLWIDQFAIRAATLLGFGQKREELPDYPWPQEQLVVGK